MFENGEKAFTLIELFIVVAILAILAAIAVPNFMEAQVRSKVSQTKSDLRSLATAMESYKIDNFSYPPDSAFYGPSGRFFAGGGYLTQDQVNKLQVLLPLSTPISYITSLPDDVFKRGGFLLGNSHDRPWEKCYSYFGEQWKAVTKEGMPTKNNLWSLTSVGPDRVGNFGEYAIYGEEILNTIHGRGLHGSLYDSTNGTMSAGDVVRVGP